MKVKIGLKFRMQFLIEKLIKKHVKCKDHYSRTSGPIHHHFGLSYCSYYTVPRLALQGMPVWWQKLFIFLVSMLPSTPEYVCQRRNDNGRFITDPWANYRRGSAEVLILVEEQTRILQAAEDAAKWKVIKVESGKHVERTKQ